jgi:hypothetical protein
MISTGLLEKTVILDISLMLQDKRDCYTEGPGKGIAAVGKSGKRGGILNGLECSFVEHVIS